MTTGFGDDRGLREKIRDELASNKISSWGEWNFLAKGVPAERETAGDSLEYDVLAVDLENRRIQADIIGYDSRVQDLMQEAVSNLENQYGYLTPRVSNRMVQEDGFDPEVLEGELYWTDEDDWMLRTSEFDSVSREVFGYDILSRNYDRIRV